MSTSSPGAPMPGRGRSNSSLVMVKIEMVAPMPSPSVRTAMMVAVRCLSIMRVPYLMSCQSVSKNNSPFFNTRRGFSLEPQRDHRVHLGGPARGKVAGQQADPRQQQRDHDEGEGIGRAH